MNDTVLDLNSGEINWDLIKKMAKDNDIDVPVKKFNCKKCGVTFYSKNYIGNYPLCIKHRENYKK